MQEDILRLREQAEAEFSGAEASSRVDELRTKYLSRRGLVAALFDRLRELPPEERPSAGRLLNELRARIDGFLRARSAAEAPAPSARPDLSLPGRREWRGTVHPLTQTLEEIKAIFVSMGFGIAEGPEVEDDYHNFEALNFPPDHPARDMQDTFFLNRTALLRTHTSPVQIRVMEHHPPPVRVICPGKVYRNEAVSARSLCMFHQVEGLHVDRGVTFADLKGTLVAFIRRFYGAGTRYRFRPTFFPFTEPSADIYVGCFICRGSGCRMCKQSGWLEILGCGMVDPNVFRAVGYDPEAYTGFAFGMGIERIAALRYGVEDIRMFYANDVRFLNQF
ncbi:MAG: phenylalanine--tRNA ligase subunit alpha [Bacteroidota bacterium]